MQKSLVRKGLVVGIIVLFVGASGISLVGSRTININNTIGTTSISNWAYPPDIIVPDDFPTIQEAITAANQGECIGVRNGTYHENIMIKKQGLILCGDLDAETTIMGNGSMDTIGLNSAKNIIITDFSITTNATESNRSAIDITNVSDGFIIERNCIYGNNRIGINIYNSDNFLIKGNEIYGHKGENSYGISPILCRNFTITENHIFDNNLGIYPFFCRGGKEFNNEISCNKITDSEFSGILCVNCPIHVKNNEISNNKVGIAVGGLLANPEFFKNNITNNNISLELVFCRGFFHHNNIFSDSGESTVLKIGPGLTLAPFNYWENVLWPRGLLEPFKWSRIIFFPWLIRPYSEEDAYNIRAEAKEIFDYENDWGELEIRMPKNIDQILSEIRNVAEMESISNMSYSKIRSCLNQLL